MAKVQVLRMYESISRDPATMGRPVMAVIYSLDGQGAWEVRIPKTPNWEAQVEAAVRADAQARAKLMRLAFDV